jgi:capsular exopolysaccharide synthesis family protein
VAAPGPKPPKLLPIRERLDDALQRKVVVDPNMAPSSREQYRRLAAGLHQNQLSQGAKVVMVTSALAGEGKTLTASNLALTLSESYRRQVLLIDADLRKPSLHVVFSLKVTEGLCEGLAAPADEQLALHQVSPFLTILPAGRPTSDPMGVLTSDRMRRLVDEARETFDWVVIDTPPVGLLPDANLLASMVDGALVVIRADATPHALVQRAVEAIGTDKILGVILNRATTHTVASSYHYHTYYKPTPEGVAPPG